MSSHRIQREARTVTRMIRLYCRAHRHEPAEPCADVAPAINSAELCAECRDLLVYAHCRLERCPFQEGKTTCAKCPVHCYRPELRQCIKEVMRYSGPRMLLRHPILTVRHLIDGRREEPIRTAGAGKIPHERPGAAGKAMTNSLPGGGDPDS